MTTPKRRVSVVFKFISVVQTVFLTVFLVIPPNLVQAQTFNVLNLPAPGSLVNVSEGFVPVLLKGISLHPENPLVFDFIVDPGNTGFSDDQIREEGQRLIKYFLAALTVPEKDLWVNLAPDEQDRIIPTAFGQTEMGRDLLAQDYILKQISASMIYPEKDLGKDFWNRVYAKAKEVYGTVKIPVSTFNKVWIVPDQAVIVENEQTAFVAKGHLKVMLEEDYVALNGDRAAEVLGNNRLKDQDLKKLNSISSNVMREIILPEIEKEVNEGKNFAQLRQIYYSLVLAAWFKNNLKDNILTQVYADQQKISGVDIDDKSDKEKIYVRYMEAYREGVFNYIKEDVDANTQEMIPRQYFSGGADYTRVRDTISKRPVTEVRDIAELEVQGVIPRRALEPVSPGNSFRVLTVGLNRFNNTRDNNGGRVGDAAMLSSSGERTVLSIESILNRSQMSEAAKIEAVQAAVPVLREALKSDNSDVKAAAERVITGLLPIAQSAAGFTQNEIISAREGTFRQLAEPNVQLQAASALLSGGVDNEQSRQILSAPLSFGGQLPIQADYRQTTPTQLTRATFAALEAGLRTPEIRLVAQQQAPQMAETGLTSADRGVQLAASRLALNPNVQASPQVQNRATQAVTEIMRRGTPQERTEASAIVMERPEAFEGQSVNDRSAIDLARASVESNISESQQPLRAVTLTPDTFRALDTGLNNAGLRPTTLPAVEPLVTRGFASEDNGIRLAAAGVALNPNAQASSQVQNQATQAVTEIMKIGTPQEREQAEAIVLERSIKFTLPVVSAVREAVGERIAATQQPTRPQIQPQMQRLEIILSAPQMPQAQRIQAVEQMAPALKVALIDTTSPEIQESAQRAVVAMTPAERITIGLSEAEIARAISAAEVQLGRPETAVQAAVAFNNSGGSQDVKVQAVLQKELSQAKDLGGIDFNPALIKMEINKENGGIKVQFDPKILEEIRTQGVEGFIPVILNVQPLKTALPLLTKGSVQETVVQLTKL